jgi:hypothetical protein
LGKRTEFETTFAAGGIWPGLLSSAEGYIATELNYETPFDGRYRIRDFWCGHREFEIFRESRAEELAGFDRWAAEELVERQEFVGAYYEADGDNLVPA